MSRDELDDHGRYYLIIHAQVVRTMALLTTEPHIADVNLAERQQITCYKQTRHFFLASLS